MDRGKQIFLLILLILALFTVNYRFLNEGIEAFFDESKFVIVERVIDGDTIVSQGESIRLLGINSPERGEDYYEEAKEFLESLILNQTVKLELEGVDKYNRKLAYVFLNGENINIKLVEEGFANYYFYSGNEKYGEELILAWENCMVNGKNLCQKSEHVCANCISIDSKIIMNNCSFDCYIEDWKMLGEGRKEFVFSEKILKSGEEMEFELDLSNSGGSLFLRDSEGKLVLFQSY